MKRPGNQSLVILFIPSTASPSLIIITGSDNMSWDDLIESSYHHHIPSRYRPTAFSGSEVTYESISTVGRTPWTGDQPDSRPLHTQDNTTQKKHGRTSMPRAGFQAAIPMFERPKTVRALDRATIWTGDLIE